MDLHSLRGCLIPTSFPDADPQAREGRPLSDDGSGGAADNFAVTLTRIEWWRLGRDWGEVVAFATPSRPSWSATAEGSRYVCGAVFDAIEG